MNIYINKGCLNHVFGVNSGYYKQTMHTVETTVEGGVLNALKLNPQSPGTACSVALTVMSNSTATKHSTEINLINMEATHQIMTLHNMIDNYEKRGYLIPMMLEVTTDDVKSYEDFIVGVFSLSEEDPEHNFATVIVNWRNMLDKTSSSLDKNTHMFLYPMVFDLNHMVIATADPENVKIHTYMKKKEDIDAAAD